jgi:hypothetical protein
VNYRSGKDKHIQDASLRVVGQTKCGRLMHIQISNNYDATSYPHPGSGEPESACGGGYSLVVNVQKWTDLIREVPIEKLELCNQCFRKVR